MTKRTYGRASGLRRSVRWARHRVGRVYRALLPEPDAFAEFRDPRGPDLIPTADVLRDPERDKVRSLVILLPFLEMPMLSGGPNTALSIGARVAERGVPVRVVATQGPVDQDKSALESHAAGLAPGSVAVRTMTFESVADSRTPLRLGRNEVLMATWWPTAYLARDALRATACREFLYLIQDYEPAFYAASSYSVLARATYDLPFRAVFNGASLREHFRREDIGLFGRDEPSGSSIAFEPAVDRSVFRPLAREGRRRLLFYARPRNARNAFELGLKALRVAVDRGAFSDEWEFFSIGDQIPALDLGRGKLLQPIPWLDLQDYAALLGRSEVLLSLMLSPHPSYPPLEMAATGGTVLTNAFGVKTAASLSALSNRIIAVEPEIDLLADGLAAIAAAPRTESSTGDLNLPSTWDESLEPVIDWLHRSMADITGLRHVNVRPKAH